MTQLGINLSNVQAQTYDPIPPGEYKVMVTDSEVKNSKAGNLTLGTTLTVQEGPMNGRKVFEHFVLNNDIALKRLKSLAVAGNHPHPDFIDNNEELHGLKFLIKVSVVDDGTYGPKNKITNFKKIDGCSTVTSFPPSGNAPPTPPQNQSSTPPAAKLPWD